MKTTEYITGILGVLSAFVVVIEFMYLLKGCFQTQVDNLDPTYSPTVITSEEDDLCLDLGPGSVFTKTNACPLCNNVMSGKDTVSTIPCNHTFHKQCLQSLFYLQQDARETYICPVCGTVEPTDMVNTKRIPLT